MSGKFWENCVELPNRSYFECRDRKSDERIWSHERLGLKQGMDKEKEVCGASQGIGHLHLQKAGILSGR